MTLEPRSKSATVVPTALFLPRYQGLTFVNRVGLKAMWYDLYQMGQPDGGI